MFGIKLAPQVLQQLQTGHPIEQHLKTMTF